MENPKNFIYLSENKINLIYPQIVDAFSNARITTEINLGAFKTEIQKELKEDSSVQKLSKIISYLEKKKSIGTIEETNQYFKGKIKARILVTGFHVLISGIYTDQKNNVKTIGLCCSLKNMIGYSFDETRIKDSRFFKRNFGEFEYFERNSNSLQFAQALDRIWRKQDEFEYVEYDTNKLREQKISKIQSTFQTSLSDSQLKAINEKPRFNKTLEKYARRRLDFYFLPSLERPKRFFIRLLIGRRLEAEKFEALVSKQKIKPLAEEMKRLEKELDNWESDDQKLLDTIKRVSRNIDARLINIEFVALTMLKGTSIDEEVILGSPLYISETFE